MAKYSSKDAFFLVGGYNLTGVLTEFASGNEAVIKETTALGDTYPAFADTGIRRATLSQAGFYDDAVGSVNEALCTKEGTSQVVCFGVEGNTLGKKVSGFVGAFAGSWSRTASQQEFHRAAATYTLTGQFDDAKILHILKAETTAGNTEGADSQDNAASSAGGYAAYLQVAALALGGYTNAIVKVRHSADDSTYADLCTFTARTAIGAERKTATGTVNRHLAVSWAWTGSGSGQSVTFLVGLARL